MGAVILRVVDSFSNEAAAAFRDSHIAVGALVHTDGTPAFHVFGEGGRTHVATVTSGKRPQRERGGPFFNVNTLISNLSTALKATYKVFSPKHVPDYLGAIPHRAISNQQVRRARPVDAIVLERQPGADAQGYAGLDDDVDYHWWNLAKATMLSTLLSVGAEAGSSGQDDDIVRAMRQGASNSVSQTGQQIVQRQLNIQPTLTIRPGFPVRVMVERDLVVPLPLRRDSVTKLKLGPLADDKPVKLSVELPAAVHRDLVAYAELLGQTTRQPVTDPGKLIAPMLAHFMAGDQAFVRACRTSGQPASGAPEKSG
jgi:hypothetical protein